MISFTRKSLACRPSTVYRFSPEFAVFRFDITLTTRMKIFVKLLNGHSVALEVKPLDLIEEIKKRLEEATGIEAQQQQFGFGAILLEDGRSLSYYSIQHESTINLVGL